VKNISRGPQFLEGAGTLVHGEVTDKATDNEHVRALIDGGLLIEMPAEKPAKGKTTGDSAGKED
jgi:hypothetical protein